MSWLLWCSCAAELSSQRAAVGSNASTVRSLEARAATSSEEAAMLRIKAAEVMRERVSGGTAAALDWHEGLGEESGGRSEG